MKPVLNIDLDNVVYDFTEAQREYARTHMAPVPEVDPYFNNPVDNPHHQWNIWEQWGTTREHWQAIFRGGVKDGSIWRHGFPERGAQKGMWELHAMGFYLRVVSHRLVHAGLHDVAVRHTVDWLEANHIPYDSLALIGSEPKSNYKAEALVDDAPHNAEDWVKNTPDYAIVFSKPWNRELNTDEHHRMLRVHGWKEVVETLRIKAEEEGWL